jgi:hypothetical protein
MKETINGQYKINLDTGDIYVVGSQATERPNLEKQASLLDWAEDRVKLEQWGGIPDEEVDMSLREVFLYVGTWAVLGVASVLIRVALG